MDRCHVFRPALQNISLKRFRLRYSSYDDCYYLHWDDTVCPQLAKIKGLKNGVFSSSGLHRHCDESTGKAYVSCKENADSAHIEWRIDFSSCGLVVMTTQIKVVSSDVGLEYTVIGNDRGNEVMLSPQLGSNPVDLPELSGCSRISITASKCSLNTNSPSHLHFLGGSDATSIPLDINIDLMCPRPKDDIYCGEILLGIKFGAAPSSSREDLPGSMQGGGVIMYCHPKEGQLQVHVVEGARLVDEDTNKPFKTVVKCNLIPDFGRFSTKHTSPRHNAYPTWTENFSFTGVTKAELVYGGLEVMLYDHHHFSDSNIGGLRMCIPKTKDEIYASSPSPDSIMSSLQLKSVSPGPNSNSVRDSTSPSPVSEYSIEVHSDSEQCVLTRREKIRSLPTYHPSHSNSFESNSADSSPLLLKRTASPGVTSPNNVSPFLRLSRPDVNDHSPASSPKINSPLSLAKTFFRLSGSHFKQGSGLSPVSSPRNSPRLGRKKASCSEEDRNSEFLHWWMEDVTPGETGHWRQVLQNEGEWVYFWHCIRYKLKAT